MMFRVAVADSPDARPFLERLTREGLELTFLSPPPQTQEDCIALFAGYDAAIVLSETFSEPVLRALSSQLKVAARFGLGYDKVDLAAAEKYGICVTNAAGTMSRAVAETAFLLMLEAARRFTCFDADMHAGIWKKDYCGAELEGKTVGIVGFGNIGQKLAQYCRGFRCRLLVHDVRYDHAGMEEYGAQPTSLLELAAQSDFVSLHCPLGAGTAGLIGETFLRAMKPTAYLVNTARGQIVDEAALIRALREGWIAGAGLDVFEREPLPGDSPLIGMQNVVMLPHAASFTSESMLECALDVGASLKAVRDGQVPPHCLNPGYRAHR